MKFSYTARNNQGALERGELEIPSERELAEYLRAKGLFLTHAEVTGAVAQATRKAARAWWVHVPPAEKIFFTQNLQVMVRAGLSVSASIKTLAQQTTNHTLQGILQDIYEKVDRGVALADAFALHPKVFSELFVNMIRAGEKSGKLIEVLEQLTTQMRKNHTLVSKVRGALTYPIIVVAAMLGIAVAMMTFVIPKITALFTEVHVELPLPTRILITTSNLLINDGVWVAAGAIALVAAFLRIIHTKRGRRSWHRFLLRLPIMGPILKKINLAKFARTFSSLLKTDIPIVQAFQITATTLNNMSYRLAIEAAAESVKKGVGISTIVREYTKLFPPLMIQMIAVGEETGSLDTILEELASFYEEDVDLTMSNLSTIIEPVLMLMLGAGVGLLAVSIVMPIYNLSEAI